MLDILSWMEKLQKWDLSSYMNAYRAQIYATSSGPEQVGLNTQRHKLPKAYAKPIMTRFSFATLGQALALCFLPWTLMLRGSSYRS